MQASNVLMIEPVNFKFNPETAVNNAFQKEGGKNVQAKALEEFNNLVDLLRQNKIDVLVVKDTLEPETPDALFPNNWISFHEGNIIFLYPMFAKNRRLERKQHVLDAVKKKFKVKQIHDLSEHEKNGYFLEGTGSMVFDHVNKIAYSSISPRTDELVLHEFCSISKYIPVSFASKDKNGKKIYHCNVLMCVGHAFVVICLDVIYDVVDREKLMHLFSRTGKEIIEISLEQMQSFAGNMLQLKNADGELVLVMSTQAFKSLRKDQVKKLQSFNKVIHTSLNTIETHGGGSARCMIAEIFNDPK